MGETDHHRIAMVRHIDLLTDYYRGQHVYVTGDLLVYYKQGHPKKYVVPDAFVVKGIEPKKRRVYKIWVEGKGPDVVIETTSRKTKRKDTVVKPKLYARLRVREYFLFDPTSDYLDPPLDGYRLAGAKYQRIKADATGALVSKELGLRLRAERGQLEFYRLDTGERLLNADEARQAAETARRKEATARRAAEAARREEATARRAAEATRREEAAARQAAENEVARLREELRRRSAGEE
jgi:Uma2 family endonuclease